MPLYTLSHPLDFEELDQAVKHFARQGLIDATGHVTLGRDISSGSISVMQNPS